jgi:hypothetical protein
MYRAQHQLYFSRPQAPVVGHSLLDKEYVCAQLGTALGTEQGAWWRLSRAACRVFCGVAGAQ